MALGFKKPIAKDDPRLQGHETIYQPSRGGSFPPNQAQQANAQTEAQQAKPKKRFGRS
ncbi:hypothetical protein ACIQTN_25825 [Streptomyces werraensis]|uniref:hypothetical protein n=1 Tax=Streptomyces werraensis TaxID=68284 RepID=UPI0038102CD2